MNNIAAIVASDLLDLRPVVARTIAAFPGVDRALVSQHQDDGVTLVEVPVYPRQSGRRSSLSSLCAHVICADARLDNRKDLIEELAIETDDCSDAELILAAYVRWGAECVHRLLGDFAFIVWNSDRASLFAARDPLGLRLLYYASTQRQTVLASTLAAVLAALPQRPAINQALLRDYLQTDLHAWTRETAFEGVFRVPQGHHIQCTPTGCQLTRWYSPPAPVRNLRQDTEYVEEFRTLFRQSVAARLRTPGPIAILLSGGLDSSGLACEADQLVAQGTATVELRSYSSVFDEIRESDERDYVAAVLETCPNISGTLIPCDDAWPLRELGGEGGYPMDEPENGLIRALLRRRIEPALLDGCRVVLSGYGADQLMSTDYHWPYLLSEYPIADQAREARHFFARGPALGVLARAYIPATILTAVTGKERLSDEGSVFGPSRSPSRTLVARAIGGGAESARLAECDRFARWLGFEWANPFYDLRLVEFVLRLPLRLLLGRGTKKYVYKEAMRGRLPEPVRARLTKPLATQLWHRGLQREADKISHLLTAPRVLTCGFMSARVISRLTDEWQADKLSVNRRRMFARLLYLEAWLRHHRL